MCHFITYLLLVSHDGSYFGNFLTLWKFLFCIIDFIINQLFDNIISYGVTYEI